MEFLTSRPDIRGVIVVIKMSIVGRPVHWGIVTFSCNTKLGNKYYMRSIDLIPDSVIPEFAHTGPREFRSPAQKQLTVCFVQSGDYWFGYTGFLTYRTLNLSPNQSVLNFSSNGRIGTKSTTTSFSDLIGCGKFLTNDTLIRRRPIAWFLLRFFLFAPHWINFLQNVWKNIDPTSSDSLTIIIIGQQQLNLLLKNYTYPEFLEKWEDKTTIQHCLGIY